MRIQHANHDWHVEHPETALKLFGFNSYEETTKCLSSFFTKVEIDHPKISTMNNEITLCPSHLLQFEETLIAKMSMQCFSHGTKTSLIMGLSRQTVTRKIENGYPYIELSDPMHQCFQCPMNATKNKCLMSIIILI